ncbi:hypothetical protein FIU87_08360 [Bacillus sp. THAF10]|nr:hypothetical protein FIU87_08360 [Bacillus sp. THAF10]
MKKKKIDSRYRIAHREALIGITLVVFQFVWWYGFAYGLGSGPVLEYSYVLGLPAWFFYSCVLGFIVMVILVVLVVKFLFVDVSLEEEEKGDSP